MLTTQKSLIFSLVTLLISTSTTYAATTAPTLPEGLEFSLAGGPDWMAAHSTHFIISSSETDSVKVKKVTDTPLWKVGAGYNVLKHQQRSYFNQLLLELNLYHTTATVSGRTWQYQSSEFNNYYFHAPVNSTRLMFDVKPNLFTWRQLSPYAIVGAGIAWDSMAYRDTPSAPDIPADSFVRLQKKTNTTMAYDAGIGCRVAITEHLSGSMEYLYTYLGKIAPSGTSTSEVAVTTAPKFTMHSQGVLLGLNWTV